MLIISLFSGHRVTKLADLHHASLLKMNYHSIDRCFVVVVVVVAGSDFSCYPEEYGGNLVQVLPEAPVKSYNREHLDALDLQFPL